MKYVIKIQHKLNFYLLVEKRNHRLKIAKAFHSILLQSHLSE
jgi:hypothetical protein